MKKKLIINPGNIHFEKASAHYQAEIFRWLSLPHMLEFWDNSQEHKDDIVNFINGRTKPSNYFNGIFTYWLGFDAQEPFSLLMTSIVDPADDCPPIWKTHLSSTGVTYTIDYGIGNDRYLGQGFAAQTLALFTEYFKLEVNQQADTFFIDPAINNPRAKHVYEKAGFKLVGEYQAEGKYWDFGENSSFLLVKKL